MILYGTTELSFPTPEAQAWVEGNISLGDVYEFRRGIVAPSAHDGWPAPSLRDAIRPVRLGRLYWPRSAQRWSTFHFLVTDEQLRKIRQQVYDAGAPGKYKALDLTLWDENTIGRYVKTEMYMLPPRPLAQVAGKNGLYLLTLVDERYFWWEVASNITLTAGTTTWATLYASIATALGITLDADTVAAAYLKPSADLQNGYDYLPRLLDAVAASVGHEIVRLLDGTVLACNPATAKAQLATNLSANQVPGQAGGKFAFTTGQVNDLQALVPASVTTVFPRADDGTIQDTFYTVEKTLSSLALADFAGITGHTGTKILRSACVANYTYAIEPANSAELAALAAQIAADWYNWRLAKLDWKLAGLAPWVPEGLHDHVEWACRPGECSTRIQRPEWNELVEAGAGSHYGTYGAAPAEGIEISLVSNVCPNPGYVAKIKPSTTQTVAADGADHAITFATAAYDAFSMRSGSSIIALRYGHATVRAYLAIQSGAFVAGNYLGLNILVNGTNVDPGELKWIQGTSSQNVSHEWEGYFNDGDAITVTLKNGTAVNPLTVLADSYLTFKESYPPITVERRDVTVLAASDPACESNPANCCPDVGAGSGSGDGGLALIDVPNVTGVIEKPLLQPISGTGGTLTPNIPNWVAENDLLLLITHVSPGASGTISVATGWTFIPEYQNYASGSGFISVLYKTYTAGLADPVITYTGFSAGSTKQAVVIPVRRANLSDPVGATQTPVAGIGQHNIGTFNPFATVYNQAVFMVYTRLDGWDNARVPANGFFPMWEIVDSSITTAPESAMGVAYGINNVGGVVLPSQVVTVHGGAGGNTLGIMFSINGGTTSGGAGGGTEACSSCNGGVAAAEYTFTIAGITNGVCTDCANANGTFTLTHHATCTWRTPTFTLCGVAGAYWQLSATSIIQSLGLYKASGVAVVVYEYLGSWDCLSSLALAKVTVDSDCNTPASVTVTPI